MVDVFIFVAILISFFVTLFMMPFWIRKMHDLGALWEDMNKYGHPKNVASSGGLIVILAFIIGVSVYIGASVLIFGLEEKNIVNIFAIISVILILTLIGLIDDMFGWKIDSMKDKSKPRQGLSRRMRLILAAFAAIPLMVINAGNSTLSLPFFGEISFGLIYPLVLIPIAIMGASSTFNFLAGFNGLEAGLGVILLSFISFVAYQTGNAYLTVVGLIMVSSLIAFYVYNRTPAKAFPGNSLLWSVGGLVACMCILGNFEKIALIAFIPYILETILKLRGKLEMQSFGKPDKNNELDLLYPKLYGLTHVSIWILRKVQIKATENRVVYLIWAFQVICIILAYFAM